MYQFIRRAYMNPFMRHRKQIELLVHLKPTEA